MAAVLRGEGELAPVRSSDLLRKGETFFPTRERSGGDLDSKSWAPLENGKRPENRGIGKCRCLPRLRHRFGAGGRGRVPKCHLSPPGVAAQLPRGTGVAEEPVRIIPLRAPGRDCKSRRGGNVTRGDAFPKGKAIPPGFRHSAARSRAGPSEIPSPDSCSCCKSHPGLPSCNTGGKVREGEQPGSPSPAPSPAEVRPFPALRGRVTKVWVRSESQFPTVASQSERARDNGKASITAWQIACELPGDNTPLPKEQVGRGVWDTIGFGIAALGRERGKALPVIIIRLLPDVGNLDISMCCLFPGCLEMKHRRLIPGRDNALRPKERLKRERCRIRGTKPFH
ncbi:uncharacterized protein LOC108962842 [Serinus canaria]|uniref:uncharacterized protein LOC108962842 n=1 Tax=Serinus canaria TaxID=9135 RepID=UPI0021CC7ADD|nr:uncharacterized protein LOC108962842 [Serinus canaria]